MVWTQHLSDVRDGATRGVPARVVVAVPTQSFSLVTALLLAKTGYRYRFYPRC
jgi:hypothetical protein